MDGPRNTAVSLHCWRTGTMERSGKERGNHGFLLFLLLILMLLWTKWPYRRCTSARPSAPFGHFFQPWRWRSAAELAFCPCRSNSASIAVRQLLRLLLLAATAVANNRGGRQRPFFRETAVCRPPLCSPDVEKGEVKCRYPGSSVTSPSSSSSSLRLLLPRPPLLLSVAQSSSPPAVVTEAAAARPPWIRMVIIAGRL
jgi:hypothetical protein